MARNYTTKDFFRKMPNALLARYFHKENLFTELDFSTMKETKPDALFAVWLNLEETQRHTIDTIFYEIFDMSCEKGSLAIIDEASWQLQKNPVELNLFINNLSSLPNHFHRAMVAYLDYPQFWKGATRFYHADTLSYWRKRKNLGHNPASVDKISTDLLAQLIGDYFHNTEGRGRNCEVESYRRGERDYFFAYPEDYSQQSLEWVDGEFKNRPHNPAFEIVFVYSQKEGSLDLHFQGSYKAIEPLQAIFAAAILKQETLPPDPKDMRVYDLDQLAQRDFKFDFAIDCGIQTVKIRKLRLSSKWNKGDRISIEADVTDNANAIYDLLKKIDNLHAYNVTQVDISASMQQDMDKPAKIVPIRITYPNSCSLKYDERDLKLRMMLESSGIELKEIPEEIHEA